MSSKKSMISVAIGSVFAATLVTAPVFAADNPFVRHDTVEQFCYDSSGLTSL